MYDKELYHYGVPGMKWGVRKSDRYAKKRYDYKGRGKTVNTIDSFNGSSSNPNVKNSSFKTKSSKTKNEGKNNRSNARFNEYGNIAKISSNAAREAANIAGNIGRMSGPSKKVRKDLSSMSDSELRSRINRLQMEQTYSNLNPSKVSRGADYAKNILEIAGSVAAVSGSVLYIANAIKKLRS